MSPTLLLLVACTPVEDVSKDTLPGNDVTDTDTDTPPTPTEGERATLVGDVTWSVDFGPDSEAAGMADCSYTRTYTGAEDASAPWLCPACEGVFLADVDLTAGLEDCFALVSTSEPLATEYLGYGGGVWYRGAGSWLTERGPATLDGDQLTISQTATAEELGEDFGFDIAGVLTLGVEAGDPNRGFVAPETYACGWPKADPAPYTGDYAAAIGATLPDGIFADICEEPVRLHDFAGTYLIVDISAMDCGPCQSAADEEEAFVASLEAQGLPVHVITLLAPSLSNTAGTPTHAELQDWIDGFALTSPVLADRVWGLSVVGQQIPDDFGYPTFVVVAPDLTIVDIQVGFGDWSSLEEIIVADAGG